MIRYLLFKDDLNDLTGIKTVKFILICSLIKNKNKSI